MSQWPTYVLVAFILIGAAFALLLVGLYLQFVCRTRLAGHPWQALRARLGLGLEVRALARRLDLPLVDLIAFEPRYSERRIPKKRGGVRVLQVPSAATKDLQRRILHRLLRRLKAHPNATGFERHKSIVDNALPHVAQTVVVKMDIVDFFPATAEHRIERYFRRIGWNRKAAALLTRLVTFDAGLPQGAPTSPRLSNLVNQQLDATLTHYAKARGGQYTRYADDITFSFKRDRPRRIRGVIQQTAALLKAHGYQMHKRRKLHIHRCHHQQRVTGLVVNRKVALPRATRRWLRAVDHRLQTGGNATLTPVQRAGWQALQHMIEQQAGPAA